MLDNPVLLLIPAAAIAAVVWKGKAKRRGQKAARPPAGQWTDARIPSAVRHYVLKGGEIPFPLDSRALQAVLRLLQDDENLQLARTSFARACGLLGDTPPADGVRTLALYLKHPAKVVRATAARTIAKTGTPESIPSLTSALADPEADVRHAALEGLTLSLQRPGVPQTLRNALQPALSQLPEQDEEHAAPILRLLAAETVS